MSNDKSEIVEGWLKKKKSEGSSVFFSSYNKRWFALDIKNAVLSYSNKPNKKSSKFISLREITSVEQPKNGYNTYVGKWEYKFTVVTKDRSYELVAKSTEDVRQWIDAFNTVLALKDDTSNENEKKKRKKKKKKSKNKQLADEMFIKKGPMDTVQLEPPTVSDDLHIEEASFSVNDSNFGETDRHSNRKFTKLQSYNFHTIRQVTEIEKLRVSDPSSEASKNTHNTSVEKNMKSDESSNADQIESSNLKAEDSFEDNWDEDATDMSKVSKYEQSNRRGFANTNFAF